MSIPEPPAVPAGDLIADFDRVRAGRYPGRDRAGLVTATVDGDGLIVKVTFVNTIGRHDPRMVEEAVRAAVQAARRRLTEALGALAATGESATGTEPADEGLPDGVLTDKARVEER
jgi:DNA-binding protein YbaB